MHKDYKRVMSMLESVNVLLLDAYKEASDIDSTVARDICDVMTQTRLILRNVNYMNVSWKMEAANADRS